MITKDQAIERARKIYGVPDDMILHKRSRLSCAIERMAMFMLTCWSYKSYPEIAEAFGLRSHSNCVDRVKRYVRNVESQGIKLPKMKRGLMPETFTPPVEVVDEIQI